jgi:hypothetical protein
MASTNTLASAAVNSSRRGTSGDTQPVFISMTPAGMRSEISARSVAAPSRPAHSARAWGTVRVQAGPLGARTGGYLPVDVNGHEEQCQRRRTGSCLVCRRTNQEKQSCTPRHGHLPTLKCVVRATAGAGHHSNAVRIEKGGVEVGCSSQRDPDSSNRQISSRTVHRPDALSAARPRTAQAGPPPRNPSRCRTAWGVGPVSWPEPGVEWCSSVFSGCARGWAQCFRWGCPAAG